MHKAMFERVYSKPYALDDKDREILAQRIGEWSAYEGGPRVGEYFLTPDGYLRFTHDWGETIQTTVKPGYDSSFYFGRGGYMSFSGSLNPGIRTDSLELTSEIRDGACWFFSHDYSEAHNGVHVTAPCRVWRLKTEAS